MRYVQFLLLTLYMVASCFTGSSKATPAADAFPLTTHPTDHSVTSSIHMLPESVDIADTLIFEQWLTTHSPDPVTGLFLTIHLPSPLIPLKQEASINGQPLQPSLSTGNAFDGYIPRHTIFDSPIGLPDFVLASGDSLHMKLFIRVADVGEFAVPTIGAGFMIGTQPAFAVNESGPIIITVTGDDCCLLRGNVDGTGRVTVSDLTYLISMLFRNGPPAPCPSEANVDGQSGSGSPVTIADLTYLVHFLFRGGQPPPPCL